MLPSMGNKRCTIARKRTCSLPLAITGLCSFCGLWNPPKKQILYIMFGFWFGLLFLFNQMTSNHQPEISTQICCIVPASVPRWPQPTPRKNQPHSKHSLEPFFPVCCNSGCAEVGILVFLLRQPIPPFHPYFGGLKVITDEGASEKW